MCLTACRRFFRAFFVWPRFHAMLRKEFATMVRDPATAGMVIGVPIMQLILFGYAINTRPKHLPIALVTADQSPLVHQITERIEKTHYLTFTHHVSKKVANTLMAENKIQFFLEIPPHFTQKVMMHMHPSILLVADNTDAMATAAATSAIQQALSTQFTHNDRGTLDFLTPPPPQMNLVVHKRYNPLDLTRYTIVPGLLGVTLTMTLVMVTAGQIAKEYEKGTMEMLLATPLRPLEVLIAKITPYLLVGYLQMSVILAVMVFVLHIPLVGHVLYLYLGAFPFIACNLAVGIMLSTFAKSQIQAMVTSVYFFLPSMLLTGFMFPFQGMPEWAQMIGNMLPMTHFIQIARGVILKDIGLAVVGKMLIPIVVFLMTVMLIAVKSYRSTLD